MTPDPTAALEVSVVIVNWNARDHLLECLDSLSSNPSSRPWEAIVVDNGSVDGSAAAVRSHAPWVTVIANRSGRGLAAANNQGLAASRGDVVVISNPDVVFPPGALDELCALLERHPGAAFGVPRLVHPDGRLQSSAGDLPTLREAVLGRQYQRRRARSAPGGFCWDGWAHDEERPVGRAGDACYVARRSAIAEIGPQDEAFPLDWEAVDWSARARDAGWEIWFSPRPVVIHDSGGSTSKAAPARWVFATHRGMYRYFRKRRSPAWRPLLAALFGGRAVAKLAVMQAGVPMYERARRATRASL